jgi:hypothetical protein
MANSPQSQLISDEEMRKQKRRNAYRNTILSSSEMAPTAGKNTLG